MRSRSGHTFVKLGAMWSSASFIIFFSLWIEVQEYHQIATVANDNGGEAHFVNGISTTSSPAISINASDPTATAHNNSGQIINVDSLNEILNPIVIEAASIVNGTHLGSSLTTFVNRSGYAAIGFNCSSPSTIGVFDITSQDHQYCSNDAVSSDAIKSDILLELCLNFEEKGGL